MAFNKLDGWVAHRMADRSAVEARPLTVRQVFRMAEDSAKRDNPNADTAEIAVSTSLRVKLGTKPYAGKAPAPDRSPTAADLGRATRRALVKSGKHLR